MAQEKKEPSRRDFIKTLAGLGLGAAMAQTLYSSLNPKQRAQLVAWAQSFGKPMTYAELGRLIDAAAWDDVVRAVRYQPASYIVYQAPDGSYQAKNGNTGQIEFSGTDAASVIQQAINALSAGGGGKVFVKAGAYTITASIVMNSFVVLEGELISYLPTVTRGTYFKLASGVKGFTAAPNAYAFGLRNISIDGQGVSNIGIEFLNVGAIVVENVGVVNCNSYGIRIQVWDSLFSNVEVEYCNSYGWYIGGSSNSLWIHCTSWGNLYDQWLITADHGKSAFIQCRAGRFDTNNGLSGFLLQDATNVHLYSPMIDNMQYHGIRLYGASNCEIISPSITNCGRAANNTYYGIYVHPSPSKNSTKNIIIGGVIANTGVAENVKYGVYEADINQRDNLYLGIKVLNYATAPFYIQGLGSRVKYCPGYYTENFKASGLSVPIGTGGAYGSAKAITSPSGIISYPRVKITWGGTFGAGETVTVKVEAVYTDGTTAFVETSATTTGSLWLTDDNILALITQGKDIGNLNIYAKTNLASTSTTVTVDAYGKG